MLKRTQMYGDTELFQQSYDVEVWIKRTIYIGFQNIQTKQHSSIIIGAISQNSCSWLVYFIIWDIKRVMNNINKVTIFHVLGKIKSVIEQMANLGHLASLLIICIVCFFSSLNLPLYIYAYIYMMTQHDGRYHNGQFKGPQHKRLE